MRNFDTAEDLKGAPQIQSFKQDWYDTGPGYIFNNFITIGKDHTKEISECQNPNSASHTILIKREGAFNLWHSLMEIFSYTLTLDIFTLSSNNPTGVPFFNQPYDAETSQVLILDDGDEGPYFELWHLLAKRPILRMSDLQTSNTTCIKNLVVPLSGATNPMWQGDWIPLDCTESKMLLVFIDRVLTHLSITPQRDPSAKLVLTYIDRKSSRKLENQALLLDDLKTTYPDITINIVDFAALSFREQVETVATTDILVGVHGAGLTHSMWLPPHSAVVEILPEKVGHKGFRNLAKLRGHQYFSTHGSPTQDDGTDWHYKSVVIEAPRFLDLVGTAIKTMYHKGLLDQDILKR
jgi:protein O-GlcNAc transferase